MKLLILHKTRKGKKSFTLDSPDQYGYNIECSDKAGVVTFNNITAIEWLCEGEHVYLTPKPISSANRYNLAKYDQVIIRKAKAIEKQTFISRIGDE